MDNKTTLFNVRLTNDEHAMLKRIAQRAHTNLSVELRRMIREDFDRMRRKKKKEENAA